nr:NAD(P)-dependent alcohol dehydrogenase [uncultured Carboxylicivirga sp.]
MKASYYTKYGSPDVLEFKDIPKPQAKEKELLIKVFATTVNRTDGAMLKADLWIMRLLTGIGSPRNPVLGTDFAGIIEEVGSKVTHYKVGDKVFGFDDMGVSSHAEYLCISEHKAIGHIHTPMSYTEAAALMEGAHYAYNFINKIDIKEGDKILVNGGTGAIGSAAIQLLVHYGAVITATCRGEHKELVMQLGATKAIDYEKEDFTKTNEEYNYVFDMVEKSTFGECKKILKPGGIYLSSELGPYAQNAFLAIFGILSNGKKVKFPFPSNTQASINIINQLAKQGAFKPVIEKVLPFDQIKEAFDYVLTGKKVGNVVIKMKEDNSSKNLY